VAYTHEVHVQLQLKCYSMPPRVHMTVAPGYWGP